MTTDRETFDKLVRSAGFSADGAALDALKEGATGAQQTHRAVEAAFAHALGNGLIRLVPLSEWPEFRKIGVSVEEALAAGESTNAE